MDDSVLPTGWSKRTNADGRVYYANDLEKKTQWERPAGPVPPTTLLPPGWSQRIDADGRTYYANDVMGSTQWERPIVVPQSRLPPPSSSSSVQGGAVDDGSDAAALFASGNVLSLMVEGRVAAPEPVYVHVVEHGRGAGNLVFFRCDGSKTPMRAQNDGSLAFTSGGRDPSMLWRVLPAGPGAVRILSVKHQNDYSIDGSDGWYIGLASVDGPPRVVANAPRERGRIVPSLIRQIGGRRAAATAQRARGKASSSSGGGIRGALSALGNVGRYAVGRVQALISPSSTLLQTGSIVTLTNVATGGSLREPLYAHMITRGAFGRAFFARCDGSKATLTVMPSGEVHYDGGYETMSQWVTEQVGGEPAERRADGRVASGSIVALRCVAGEGRANRAGGLDWYLGMDADGTLVGNDSVDNTSAHWQLTILCNMALRVEKLLKEVPAFDGTVSLTAEQKTQFYLDGYLHLPQVVSRELVDAALQVINTALGDPGSWHRNPDFGHWDLKGVDGTLGSHPAILALLYAAPTHAYTQELLGRDNVNMPRGGQVAVRMPNPDANHDAPQHWHIDGLNKGHHSSFSLLVGVTLSDQLGPDWGNLVVFPGQHHVMGAKLLAAVMEARAEAAARGPGVDDAVSDDLNSFIRQPLSGGIALQPHAGDVILVHHKVPHRVHHNHSPHIRYQIYFRVSSKTGAPYDTVTLENIFFGFEGMDDVVAQLQ
ncbi:uncharacterized protein AMSG_00666 [Thecamonas trahens ATCC 50062]|uniref:WW domain-containing protein n=1 Tax=Thecamonas trahens ATCC 50062 TaxID=461836 RepID=A0A0L0DE45_THETB|nr:hypothetical protein AMSG_00666 [Thecamonas trahens ATCC 50062]KNC50505.1 hypothetical protein AMSG_00666 [Thecamonas trahens ATCC 50062]|eukprot:XP_013762398.1 hypothetical protein AMSG_00666 [Thecamonas trahens ATCC 50062]